MKHTINSSLNDLDKQWRTWDRDVRRRWPRLSRLERELAYVVWQESEDSAMWAQMAALERRAHMRRVYLKRARGPLWLRAMRWAWRVV